MWRTLPETLVRPGCDVSSGYSTREARSKAAGRRGGRMHERQRRGGGRDAPSARLCRVTPTRLALLAVTVGSPRAGRRAARARGQLGRPALAAHLGADAGPPARLAAPARGAPRPGRHSCCRGGLGALRGAPGDAPRDAGGDQQVGLVVRTLPGGVRRLPAGVGAAAAARSPSSGSTPATASKGRPNRFLRSFPVSYPSYFDPSGQAGAAITDSSFTPVTVFLDPHGGLYIHQGPYPERREARTRRPALRAGRLSAMPELRIDPLSGHRTIVAGERSRRPGGEPRCAPAEPIDPEQDPFAEGHEDRTPPELYAVRPDGGAAGLPGLDGAGGAEPLPRARPAAPARRLAALEAEPGGARARRPGAVRLAARDRGARGDRSTARSPVLSLADLPAEQVGRRGGGVARADARARRQRLRAADRQRAPRGGRLAAAHPRPALRAGLRPGRRGARARARGRLHDADDGPEPAGRPRRRGGATRRAGRGDRRGGRADRAVRLAAAVPADARPARAAAALRGGRARAAPRCCTTGCSGWRAGSARARR